MKKKFENVYQFKITLNDIKPKIWRLIQVPETYNFEQLHYAIQEVMGWQNYHLHEFTIPDPSTGLEVRIGMPEDSDISDLGYPVLEERKNKILDYFSRGNSKAIYTYDFGDDWEHIVKFEKFVPRERSIKYPVCLSGARACPPEDCGGSWGYMDLLETLQSKDSEDFKEMREWVGEEFDPEYFDKDDVIFSDSQ